MAVLSSVLSIHSSSETIDIERFPVFQTNAIIRPPAITAVHNKSDSPPASLAATAGTSDRVTLRWIVKWNRRANSRQTILNWNEGFSWYLTASAENISGPV